jgi:hypothetical protein
MEKFFGLLLQYVFRKDIYKEGNVGVALDPYFICMQVF